SLATSAVSSVDAPPKERLLGLESDAQLDGRDLGDRMLALNANIVGVPSQVMWRRSALGEASVMAIGARGWRVGDVAHWLALLARGDASYIHDELVTLRLHKGQDQARPRFRVEAAFDWLEMAEVAARHGFLRRPADQCAATTAALRQLAWRFDPALPEARDLLHGVRVAAERLRVHHGGPPSLRAVLGKTTTLFVERGDGSDSARLVRRWVSAYSSRTDVRLVIAAAPERLAAVRALLRPLREDPDAPASMANVEELPLTRAICLPGPVLLLEAGVTVDELKEAVPPRGRPECDEPWADPALAAMSDVERELRGRSGPPRWAA
ncbi:MAG: hypothetical protein ACRDYD_07385, partial [Acidimicrobiales bacterium]